MQIPEGRQVLSARWHRRVGLQEGKGCAESAWRSWMENAGNAFGSLLAVSWGCICAPRVSGKQGMSFPSL